MGYSYAEALKEPLLGLDQERQAIEKWQGEGDRASLELLLRSHARQAYAQATRWTDNPSYIEDLVAEGMIALMRAAERFDLTREVRFSTYAAWWLRTAMAEAYGRISAVIDVPVKALAEARRAGEALAQRNVVALDGGARASEEDDMSDRLACPEPTPEDRIIRDSSRDAAARLLHAALASLSETERTILARRKLSDRPAPVDALAAELSMSPTRLRQIETRAMGRLRQRLIEGGFSKGMLT
ncbi:sigma32-like factor [Oceanicola granulosus HTCC2516]|uniref:Sigma32-like factor n=1 Tax=Oceanicola granulosus (strain ATCC BAA-861 / DSM 15982 / KCTC 12143 / HTCC2516) TaxID=314256 RepID=Q2CGF6_OCEGH|nr:sigma-70 family RNA polymerase sigma factor [Oceanicola granulosus]EAR51762.1 sigma32-like factor [Oceanicola granulosus HTCC2516]